MIQNYKILIICNSQFISGAEISLFQFIEKGKLEDNIILVIPKRFIISKNKQYKVYYLPFVCFYKTYNPIILFRFICSIFISTIILYDIVKKYNIKLVYLNSIKSTPYGALIKGLTKVKIINHLRDSLTSFSVYKPLLKSVDILISISNYIYNQVPINFKSNYLIYGGIDTNHCKPYIENISNDITKTSITIACIGQITRWKNQTDFLKAAKIINNKNSNIKFHIIGDDLSGKEKKYMNELLKLTKSLNMQNKVHFLGHQEDIRNIMNNIDILVHPAINEPFGRVLIEAMAVEIPVVAYNCGGPAEIVLDEETGYLAEPENYMQLADKTMELIDNKELRTKMGRAGRQRVIEKFNIERYIREMEAIFDNI